MPKFSRGTRRKTQWLGMGNAAGTAGTLPLAIDLTAGTAAVLSQGGAVAGGFGALDEEVTVTRMIGAVSVALRVQTAEVRGTVAIGCAVVRIEALAAGVGSLPSPESDPDFEWLYYGVFPLFNSVQTANSGADRTSALILPFDVHSQRIVRTGSSLVWLAESEGNNAIAGVGGRYLVKLT